MYDNHNMLQKFVQFVKTCAPYIGQLLKMNALTQMNDDNRITPS